MTETNYGKSDQPTGNVCRSCAEARGATFRPNSSAEYEIARCSICGSQHRVVYPAECWDWPRTFGKK
jgi:RNase P subunit RPR2